MTPVASPQYENWTREELIARLTVLERGTGRKRSVSKAARSKKVGKPFDYDAHAKRKIALKFCYSGWEYNGLAHQDVPTRLPTVESVLFDALARTRLIDPAKGFEGCGWEKCGRTDVGVSAAGQVVSLWVRSAIGDPQPTEEASDNGQTLGNEKSSDALGSNDESDIVEEPVSSSGSRRSQMKAELQYVSMLNRVLPITIRILAWSPVATDFSARFSTKHRHYKYFFASDGLDVGRMRDAAHLLLGEHDFRNLCKLDAGKQITDFKRKILRADIGAVDEDARQEGCEGIFVFDLIGTAFLYHQVRHIMAVLFLVGSGLEEPSVILSLLNASPDRSHLYTWGGDPVLEVVDQKPEYQMADSLPLMLWEGAYSEADVQWRGDSDHLDPNRTEDTDDSGKLSLCHQLQAIHTRSRIYTALDAYFLSAAARYHPPSMTPLPLTSTVKLEAHHGMLDIPLGGGTFRRQANYVPLLQRKRLDSTEVANERWRRGKGARRQARKLLTEPDAEE